MAVGHAANLASARDVQHVGSRIEHFDQALTKREKDSVLPDPAFSYARWRLLPMPPGDAMTNNLRGGRSTKTSQPDWRLPPH